MMLAIAIGASIGLLVSILVNKALRPATTGERFLASVVTLAILVTLLVVVLIAVTPGRER